MPLPTRTEGIQRSVASDRAFDALQQAILDGTLVPGEELRDDALIAWLGVSRAPIREALRRLADLDLVETVPNRYTRVSNIDLSVTNQANDAMSVFYEYLARTQVPLGNASTMATLDVAAAVWRGEARDRRTLSGSVHRYFSELAKSSGNELLLTCMDSLEPVLTRSLTVPSEWDDIELVVEQMILVHDAVAAGDATLAGDRVYDLFASNRQRFVESFRPTDKELDQ